MSFFHDHRCAFCQRYAKVMRTILEEVPPEYDEGELWRQWRPFDRIYLCDEHNRRFVRYRISVREEASSDDEKIADNLYRTPAGWEYQQIGNPKSIGWVRPDDDE